MLQLFEMIEKGAVEKAKDLVNLPKLKDQTRKTNAQILASLKKMGVASQDDVRELRMRISELEKEVETLREAKKPRATASATTNA